MAYDPINPLIPQQNPSLSNQGAFRFWVQTVLPTIYDDSLSYYELLNKVVQVLNAAISDVDALHSYVEDSIPPQNTKINEAVTTVNAIGEQFDTLQNYVADYFENLDVQDEINNKLDAMAEDGTLTELIEGILNSSTAINQAVAEWLEDYAETSGITAPAVDDTLSISEAAADAAITGAAVSNIMSGTGKEFQKSTTAMIISLGGLNASGNNVTDAKAVRSGANTRGTQPVYYIRMNSDTYYIDRAFVYPSAGSTANSVVLKTPGETKKEKGFFLVPTSTLKYFRFSFKRYDGADMTQTDVTAVTEACLIYRFTDPDLSVETAPADAKAVGDAISGLEASLLEKCLHYLYIGESGATSTYSNSMANLVPNTYSYISTSWFNDAPSTGDVGWAFTISPYHEMGVVPTFGVQYIKIANNKLYIRRVSGESWSNWALYDDESNILKYKGNLSNSGDLNDIVDAGIYFGSTSNTMSNKPFSNSNPFHMIVFVDSSSVTQHLLNMRTGTVYTRYKVTQWSKWRSTDHHNRLGKYYAFGDSTTKGTLVGGGVSNYNYPQAVSEYLDILVDNRAEGGQGLISDWDTIQSEYIDELDMSDASLITVGWSYNDPSQWTTMPMGVYTDTTLTSVIGYYYTIMKDFQTKCPTARVILITGFGAGSYSHPFDIDYTFQDGDHPVYEYYNELEKMCNLHGWSCINQSKGTWFSDVNRINLVGNGDSDKIHPNDNGYKAYGNFIAGKIASLYANIIDF